jgi:BlaI family penicillinase repressor
VTDRPPLAKSELEVARIVWKLGEATVRQVLDSLPEGRALDFWTVQTYLRRLVAKGYLRTRKEGRNNVYLPAVRPTRVVGELVDDFLDRLFDGSPLPLMQHLLDDGGLSDDEIKQIEAKLEQLKRERRK